MPQANLSPWDDEEEVGCFPSRTHPGSAVFKRKQLDFGLVHRRLIALIWNFQLTLVVRIGALRFSASY